jgi:hypothetical protein
MGDESWICFPNWKWNWRDDILKQCLTSKGNRKAILDSIKENDFHCAVYVPKETILKEMAAKIE